MSDDYRVQLDVFTGPLDLLLFLIKRDELDVQDIPLARIAEQYLEYVKLLEQIDPNAAGDFLVMASTLIELKSRALLPAPPIELSDDDADPRTSLVRQLLEYKRFKDAAAALGSAADERRKRYVRKPVDLPKELEGVELEEVEVWDLLSAFSRVMTAIGKGPGLHEVSFDDTPIAEYGALILDTLEERGPVRFESLFADRRDRAEVVGLLLALLELIRGQKVRAEQAAGHGPIYLFLLIETGYEDDDVDTQHAANEPPTLSISAASGRDDTETTPNAESDNGQAE